MSIHSKNFKLVILTGLILSSLSGLTGCSNKNRDIKNFDTLIIAEIQDNTYGIAELHKDKTKDYIYEVKDNKIINEIQNSSVYDTAEIIRLNEDVDKANITLKDRYTNDTYDATLEESSAHIKYLQNNGYNIIRQVNTQDFIDILLSKGSDTKRVIIYPDKLVVSSIEPKELNIKNYIK